MIYPMPEVKQHLLERTRVSNYRIIARYVWENTEFHAVERAAEDMLIELVSEVLCERVVGETQTVELNVPASWWQVFKQTYQKSRLFGWFVRQHPVKFQTLKKTVTFQRYHTYPNADIPKQITPLGRPIIYETTSQTEWSTS